MNKTALESEHKLKIEMTKQLGRTIKEYYGDDRPDYCVLNMSVLEELPVEIQKLMVAVLETIDDTFDMSESPEKFTVMARGKNNNSKGGSGIIADPFRLKSPPKWRK